jgi:hypothetical protein
MDIAFAALSLSGLHRQIDARTLDRCYSCGLLDCMRPAVAIPALPAPHQWVEITSGFGSMLRQTNN